MPGRNIDEDVDLDALARANDALQRWVSENGNSLSQDLLRLLSNLDNVAPTWEPARHMEPWEAFLEGVAASLRMRDVTLADAVNQLAMIVEEVAYGSVEKKSAQERLRRIRESIAPLIPE